MTKTQPNNKKRAAIIILVLGALALILWISGVFQDAEKEEVEVDEVAKKTIVEKVTASGELRPEKEVKISADVSGEITQLPIKEGTKVKEGDLLVQINPDEYEAAVERAKASLNNARANLANAKAQLTQAKAQLENAKQAYDRNKQLYEKDAIAEAEFEQIASEYNTQKAQVEASRQTVEASRYNVESAKANLNEAQDQLDKTQIYAPTEGTISSLSVEKGERVVGTRQMEGTEIMRIADLKKMQLLVEVNENDIIQIHEGDTAEVEVDAFVNRTFEGIVSHVANSAKNQSQAASSDQVTNFDVEIDMLRHSYFDLIDTSRLIATPFRPGMSGMARIKTKRAKDATAVPILAVTTRQKEEGRGSELEEVVFLYKGGMAVRKPVKTGIQDNYYIEVKEGLSVGQEVISGPYSAVSKTLKDSLSVQRKSTGDFDE